jgi:hypothetical protein
MPSRLWSIPLLLAFAVIANGARPRELSWFEQVEKDRDRGAGRIVDDATWETLRFQERRDVHLGRLTPRRDFDRFDEERDRELQIEAKARRDQGDEEAPTEEESLILRQRQIRGGGAGLSPLAAVVAREQRELAEAKETLQRSLRAVDNAEARSLRLLRRRLTREGRPEQFEVEKQAVQKRFESLRAGHRRVYEQVRARITGQVSH